MDSTLLRGLEMVWGEGFLSPGGNRDGISEMLGDFADAVEGRTILDFGCGFGGFSRIFATKLGARAVVGVDRDPDVLVRAVRDSEPCGGARPSFLALEDGVRIPLADDSVDLAFSKEVFLYIADRVPAFSEIHRTLRPGGSFAIIDLMRRDEDPSATMQRFMNMEDSFLPVAIDPPATFLRQLREAGFVLRSQRDISDIYLRFAVEEDALLRTLDPVRVEELGASMHGFLVDNWQSTLEVLRSGELQIHTLVATKPEPARKA